jgi:aspartokinase/homoserine dehydrogenase 1
MRHTPGVSGRLFQALGKNGISIIATAQGSSELNISTVIKHADLDKAMNALHQAFFLSDVKTLSVFLIGTGLIGGTLIKQIAHHRDYLRKSHSLEIVVAGIANSKKMIFNADGLSLQRYSEALDRSEDRMILEDFIQRMKDMNLTQSIFVDCTADEKIANTYDLILKNSISIVTPNKVANSGNQKRYERLRDNAKKGNVRFMYETNVGAGLPVINTLTDLMSSGDRIIRIEAVLSGTLSFIFNNFIEHASFSDIVREAKKRGYTEPDPRVDLSGKDVARKLLILARETGIQMELNDIKIKQLLPASCMRAKNVEDFFHELKKNDNYFEQIRRRASDKNKVLRFIAKLENGKATIGLQEIDSNHPFYNLSGSDNIISFTTERYNERPLVVKGPGAGAEVTAAGVFAEIISIAKYFE